MTEMSPRTLGQKSVEKLDEQPTRKEETIPLPASPMSSPSLSATLMSPVLIPSFSASHLHTDADADADADSDLDLDLELERKEERSENENENDNDNDNDNHNHNLNHIQDEQSVKQTPHDSMVTVRLSEPPPPVNPNLNANANPPLHINTNIVVPSLPSISKSTEESEAGEGDETPSAEVEDSPRITMMDPNGQLVGSPTSSKNTDTMNTHRRGSQDCSDEGDDEEQVNWEELERTEEQEPRDQGSDDSTALLLARLEQENNLLATNPKSGGITKAQSEEKRHVKGQSRPPSIQQLKKLVNGPTPPALRYSLIPAPPMTDLEFYAALVQDYSRTAQYLPTLLSKKIRSGIPPPLRGVVWQSMSGARDRLLEDEFDRLCGESSPYEGIIGKDLGRSFPGVEMFRDPEGDGQKMLGRVLRCFSLYDHKIGYCQGLGFIVGPLLMHMGDKQAFCVLVRLMEHYDLRNCFLPDLSGLHVRIHQFRELLKQHLPILSAHLQSLQIEPQYVSQWFLSFFAVTCPLPMLFRIYDVIFAEGASETIMRVALSLMQKNQEKILACTEFEDVMQLLLSRELWDCYHYNGDDLVNDFVSLSGVVTHESLKALEASFTESSKLGAVIPSDNIGSTASRFLGRLWQGNNTRNLSPGLTGTSRPVSFLRRSPSKQSIASTLNSTESAGAESIMSSSTDATSISRDSSNTDDSSIRTQSVSFATATMVAVPKSNKDKDLHGQIEDLLTALSELQRDNAELATQLQREREERDEDKTAVRSLLDILRKKPSSETVISSGSDRSLETVKPESEGASDLEKSDTDSAGNSPLPSPTTDSGLSELLNLVEERFTPAANRRLSMMQTRSELRNELARSKDQLVNETSKSQDLSRQLREQSQEMLNLQTQVREKQTQIRNAHTEKQRLEKQIHDLRARQSTATIESNKDESEWPARGSAVGGLRELRLGRQPSARSQTTPTFNKRVSSLSIAATSFKENDNTLPLPSPTRDMDMMVLELVQAKTAMAVAKQEAEEAKAKLEGLRKLLGMGNGDSQSAIGHRPSPSMPQSMMQRNFTGVPTPRMEAAPVANTNVTPPAAPAAGGGFWGWGKKA